MSLRFGSRTEADSARDRVAGLLHQWLNDGFDGAFGMGDAAAGFHDTSLRLSAAGATLRWPVDLGQHAPGGLLALLDRLEILLDDLGLDAELSVHPAVSDAEAPAMARHVEVSPDALAALERAGAPRVRVEIKGRPNTGVQGIDLQHTDPTWPGEQRPMIDACLEQWYAELVDVQLVTGSAGGQIEPLRIYDRGDGLMIFKARLGSDPVGAIGRLVVELARVFDVLDTEATVIVYEMAIM